METYCEECGNPSDSCNCSAYWLEQNRISKEEKMLIKEEKMLIFIFGKICVDGVKQIKKD